MLKKTPLFFSAFLAACGGASTNEDLPPLAFLEAAPLLDTVETLTPQDPATLQTSQGATFSGSMLIFLGEESAALGDMNLDVNFADNTFDGAATNFVDRSDFEYAGQLDISDGIIERDGDFNAEYSTSALLNGTLTSPQRDVEVDGFIVGDFAGDDGDYYRGYLRIGLDGATYQDGDPFGGIVAAQRD